MKLYYSPSACSLSPHIALKESGLAFESIAAPTKTHKLPDGTDYYTINPLGYLFTVAGWSKHVGIDISGLAHLSDFMTRVGTRPAVQDTLRSEGPLN